MALESAADETKTLAQEFLHRLVRVLENPASLEARIHYSDSYDALKGAPAPERNEFIKRLAPLAEAAGMHADAAPRVDRLDAADRVSPREKLARDTADMWKSPAQRS